MEYRAFGQTELQVSTVGFGCWEIGGGYGAIEVDDFEHAVSRALDLGVNCFDTAEGYGMGASERALAKALGSRRDEAIVVTKFGMAYREMPNLRDSSAARVHASIDKSLQNLGTDYVDVYLVHWPDRSVPFEETMGALDEIVQAGKVRFVGLSNFRPAEIEACMQTRRVDVVQYGWNLFDRRMQQEILPLCEKHSIGYMAYGSLAYGLLAGAFSKDTVFGADDWRSREGNMGAIKMFAALFGPDHFPRNIQVVEELQVLASRRDRSLAQFALRWATAHPTVSTSLVGCRTVAEVEDNVGAVDWAMSADELDEIDAIFARHGVNPVPEFWIEEV